MGFLVIHPNGMLTSELSASNFFSFSPAKKARGSDRSKNRRSANEFLSRPDTFMASMQLVDLRADLFRFLFGSLDLIQDLFDQRISFDIITEESQVVLVLLDVGLDLSQFVSQILAFVPGAARHCSPHFSVLRLSC